MRILHTADWHLCHKLGKLNRTDELQRRVERVAELCEEHQVEVLLIAGDLFDDRVGVAQITESLRHIHSTFKAFFARGGTILAITGNHDPDNSIDLARAGLSLAAPNLAGRELPGGRMYIQNGLNFCRLKDPSGDFVQFVLVPYPQSARYELPQGYRTREEEHRKLQEKMTDWIGDVFNKQGFDQSLPSVLMAHLHIRGSNMQGLYRLNEADDVLIDSAILKNGWTYAALGHIHMPQAVDGVESIRYPGPLDRLDFNEIQNDPGVILLEINTKGLVNSPQWLPIPPTPMYNITLTDPDKELEALTTKHPDHASAIVRVIVESEPKSMSREELARKLDDLFDYVHSLQFNINVVEATPSELRTSVETSDKTLADVVRSYVNDQLIDDPDRDDVLALCQRYLQEFEGGVKS